MLARQLTVQVHRMPLIRIKKKGENRDDNEEEEEEKDDNHDETNSIYNINTKENRLKHLCSFFLHLIFNIFFC